MKSAPDCRKHAEECRSLAKVASEEQRRQALEIAEVWDRLARDRERQQPPPDASFGPRA
jgi:hypothetical protein